MGQRIDAKDQLQKAEEQRNMCCGKPKDLAAVSHGFSGKTTAAMELEYD